MTLRTLAEAPQALQAVLREVEARGFPKETRFAIRLALDEAVTNAIRHGNGNDASKAVTVDYAVTDQRFRATICDEGCGFCPDDLPDPTACENLECPHGRGVMLMQAYMTEVHFNEAGNCVTLIKDRDCPRPRG